MRHDDDLDYVEEETLDKRFRCHTAEFKKDLGDSAARDNHFEYGCTLVLLNALNASSVAHMELMGPDFTKCGTVELSTQSINPIIPRMLIRLD